MNIEDIQKKLQNSLPNLAPTMATGMEWLLQHLPEVAWTGVEEAAEAARVSPATLVRALKQAGFSGWSDLQNLIRKQLPTTLAWRLFDHLADLEDNNFIGSIIADEKANLDQLEQCVTPQLNDLLSMLLNSRHILITASLMTTALAQHFAIHLRLLLGNVDFVDAASSLAWIRLRDLDARDMVVGLTYPRYSEATRQFLTKARERTPLVALITDLPGPPLDKMALTLRLPAISRGHYSSTVSLMAFIQVIGQNMTLRDPSRILGNLNAVDAIWQQLNVLKPE
jgi:DNA-binding MurR/RpiR family transcriptional regulator